MSKCKVYLREEVRVNDHETCSAISGNVVFLTDAWVNIHELDEAGGIVGIVNIPKDMVAFIQNNK